jgi:hypothetical protein
MHFFISIFIFIFILFFYIHLQYQYKTSEDLEIYELDYTTNKNLQEICHIKQPILFQINHLKDVDPFFHFFKQNVRFKQNDVNVKDIRDYYKPNVTSVDSVSLSFSSAQGLMETDPKGYFYSDNNFTLLREENLFSKMDNLLASSWVIQKNYDLLFGSKNTRTPLKYHTETGRFLIISSFNSTDSNSIRIKMTPWKSRKYLNVKYDYENYEFWCPIDIWENPPDKMKCLEFNVKEGYVLYIPAYWFYSIEFTNTNTCIASFTYSSGMNIISNLPNYGLFFLQRNNIKNLMNIKNITKIHSSVSNKDEVIEIKEDKKEEITEENTTNKEIQEMLSVITPVKI